MAAILELLGRQRRQRIGTADDVLAASAREHAAGKSPDLAAVDAALHELGQPLDHFGELCRIAAVRRDAGLALEKLGSATTKLRRLTETMEAERVRHEEARTAYLSRMAALEAERATIQAVVEKAEQARVTLLVPANIVGSIRQRYEEALAERDDAAGHAERLRRELREQRSRLTEADRWIESIKRGREREIVPVVLNKPTSTPPDVARQLEPHELTKKRAQRRIGELEPSLRDTEERLDRAERAVVAIELEILRT
jgi:chromosome segregation ATPase